MIIGLSGKSGSGKDSAAAHLINKHGFIRLAFADALKSSAKAIFGLTDSQLWGDRKDIVDPYWGVTPGQIMQRLGTECLRQGYADDVWIRALLRKIEPGENYVITDVRFPNEADAIRHWGGKIIRIARPGHVSARAPHPSETALDDYAFDVEIVNNGTLDELRSTVALFKEAA